MGYGTLQIFDTLNARRAAANDFIRLYDQTTLYKQLEVFLEAHNRLRTMLFDTLVETTQDWLVSWGNNDTVDMIEGDEYSRPDAQKPLVTPVGLGFPLSKKQVAYQVTRDFMETKTLGDLEQVITAATDADIRDTLKTLRAVIFNPTNNLSYKDINATQLTLPLRAFVNADGTYIPPDSFGNTFDPNTHTHYLATASFVDTNLKSLINTIVEHYNFGEIEIDINPASEDTVKSFTTGTTKFYPFYPVDITPSVNVDRAVGMTADLMNLYNRPIGKFGPATIWIRPWVPTNYLFAFNPAAPKPLRLRTTPSDPAGGNLRIAADIALYPLQAQYMQRKYGIGVFERTNGAVLYTGGGSYTAPSAWAL